MSKLFGLVLAATLMTSPVLAQNVQSENDPNAGLRDLVDYSDGYVSIRDNVVMIEGESSIQICNFALTEEFFHAIVGNNPQTIAMNQPRVSCVPLASFEVTETPNSSVESPIDLMEFVDNSESYVRVRDNILMIEGEEAIEFCLFDVSDDLFKAAAMANEDAMIANRGSVICVPFGDAVQ